MNEEDTTPTPQVPAWREPALPKAISSVLRGSDRIGALDFQTSATQYVPRIGHATLAELQTAARRLTAGEHLSPGLAEALLPGTSIGGAARRRC